MDKRLASALPLLCLALLCTGLLPAAQAAPPAPETTPPPRLQSIAGPAFLDTGAPGRPATAPEIRPSVVPGSKLVFQSYRDNNWEIYGSSDDGSGQTRLTFHNAEDAYPRLNRGYTRIAFASKRDTGDYNIYTMAPDGSDLQKITTHAADDADPAWSPDGLRIAFFSMRDGLGDIYTMDPDGGNVVKLTTHAAEDRSPCWSPDGGQIAFVSKRSGDYRIWKMNADGSDQTPLSAQADSRNPTWSPDGSRIAYDADADGDGWNELWVMNADGSDQQLVYDPGGNSEAWARSWSPDGRYIAYTRVHWVLQQGNWVWDNAVLEGWNLDSNSPVMLVSNGLEWYPDWQTVDILPPTTQVQTLPFMSPAPFTVSWGGADNGPAGLCSYDVEYKDGAGGAWTPWQTRTTATSASFTYAVGGHTYYFRSRGHDCAYNAESWPAGDDGDTHTFVEAYPPQTRVDPLPDHYQGTQIAISWGGFDPGGSGITVYDLQYRAGEAGPWTTLITQTTATAGTFTGSSGQTYYLRCRATDRAGNVEPWPAGDGDTNITMYTWAITGTARDNREVTIGGVRASVTPAAFQELPSDLTGEYGSYVAAAASSYDVGWSAAGYTSLPDTTFPGTANASYDILMPPGDNVVQNWGLEAGDLSLWQAGGVTLPGVTDTVRYTGDYAALLGCQTAAFPLPVDIAGLGGQSYTPAIWVEAGTGVVHAAWYQNGAGINGEIYYARRPAGGPWGAAEKVSASLELAGAPQLAVDGSGTVHLVWTEDTGNVPEIYYARRTGAWSTPENISHNAGVSRDPLVAVQSNGTVHVLWMDDTATPGTMNVYHAWRYTSWSDPARISDGAVNVEALQMAIDAAGNVHAVWGQGEVYYAVRESGAWSTPIAISSSGGTAHTPRLALGIGAIHVVWSESQGGSGAIVYAINDGTWATPRTIYSSGSAAAEPQMAADGSGALHVVWQVGSGSAAEVYYALRSAGGSWTNTVNVSQNGGESRRPQIAVDASRTAHVVWSDSSGGDGDILYASRHAGVWSRAKDVSRNAGSSDDVRLAAESSKSVHLVWVDNSAGNNDIYYTALASNGQTGVSQISQEVALPAAMYAPTLSFLYMLDGASPSTGSSFSVLLDPGAGPVTLFTTNTSVNDWTHRWFDLSAYAGQTVTLILQVQQTAEHACTWAYLDEVTIGGANPDLWIEQYGGAAGLPGGTVVFHLLYGNRGGAAAQGVRITEALPGALTYLAASPPPDSTAPLRWDLGTLAAGSGPHSIVITATVSGAAAPWSAHTSTAAIAGTSPEAETSNNTAAVVTTIVQRIYLPIVAKGYAP